MAKSIATPGLRTFLGRRLAERLAAQPGLRLNGLDRLRPHGLASGVQFREIDLTRPDAGGAPADLFHKDDVEVVVHLAFRREPTPDLEGDHELETIGSLHLLHACAGAGVPRLVLGSSTMVYGPHPDNPNFLDEEHPLRGHPHAHCVQNRVETERLVADWTARHPATSVTVLRPCWIVGQQLAAYCWRPALTVLLPPQSLPAPLLQSQNVCSILEAWMPSTSSPGPPARRTSRPMASPRPSGRPRRPNARAG